MLRRDSLIDRDDLRLGGFVIDASGLILSDVVPGGLGEGADCDGVVFGAPPSASGGLGEGAKLLGDRAGSGLGRIPARWSPAVETTGVPIGMRFLAATSASAASHWSGNSEEASG